MVPGQGIAEPDQAGGVDATHHGELMRGMGYGVNGERGAYVPHGFRSSFRDWSGEVWPWPMSSKTGWKPYTGAAACSPNVAG